MTIHYLETKYGFEYGAVTVERSCSDDKAGWVCLQLLTKKITLQVYVTKSGKIRISNAETHKEFKED